MSIWHYLNIIFLIPCLALYPNGSVGFLGSLADPASSWACHSTHDLGKHPLFPQIPSHTPNYTPTQANIHKNTEIYTHTHTTRLSPTLQHIHNLCNKHGQLSVIRGGDSREAQLQKHIEIMPTNQTNCFFHLFFHLLIHNWRVLQERERERERENTHEGNNKKER